MLDVGKKMWPKCRPSMPTLKCSSIFDTFWPIYIYMKVHGLAAYTFNTKTGKCQRNAKNFIWWLCLVSFFGKSSMSLIEQFLMHPSIGIPGMKSPQILTLVSVGWKYLSLFAVVTTPTFMTLNYFYKSSVENFMKSVHQFDEEVFSM